MIFPSQKEWEKMSVDQRKWYLYMLVPIPFIEIELFLIGGLYKITPLFIASIAIIALHIGFASGVFNIQCTEDKEGVGKC